MNRISRWPARMLANSRTASEITRTRCEITSIMKIAPRPKTFIDSSPGGSQLCEVLDDALGPDSLEVVGDHRDDREHERDRDVRRRGVDREARDLEPEDVDLVLGVGRQRDVAEHVREPDEEEERRQVGEPLASRASARGCCRRRCCCWSGRRRPRSPSGPCSAPAACGCAIQVITPIVSRAGEEQVEHRLVDRHVGEAEVDRDPGIEQELVLRLELLVLAVAAEDDAEQRS